MELCGVFVHTSKQLHRKTSVVLLHYLLITEEEQRCVHIHHLEHDPEPFYLPANAAATWK